MHRQHRSQTEEYVRYLSFEYYDGTFEKLHREIVQQKLNARSTVFLSSKDKMEWYFVILYDLCTNDAS
jgi:hypothetical protein